MNVAEAIREIYPNLVPEPLGSDYAVSQGPNGQYVSSWNNPNLKPTDAQLAVAWFRVAVKKKSAEFTARQIAEIAAPYQPQTKTDDPNAWLAEMMVDLAQTLRTVDQSTKLKNASDMRTKRDRGHANLATKMPGANPIAAAEQVLALRWEDIQ